MASFLNGLLFLGIKSLLLMGIIRNSIYQNWLVCFLSIFGFFLMQAVERYQLND